jgi:hypothetical protein
MTKSSSPEKRKRQEDDQAIELCTKAVADPSHLCAFSSYSIVSSRLVFLALVLVL